MTEVRERDLACAWEGMSAQALELMARGRGGGGHPGPGLSSSCVTSSQVFASPGLYFVT